MAVPDQPLIVTLVSVASSSSQSTRSVGSTTVQSGGEDPDGGIKAGEVDPTQHRIRETSVALADAVEGVARGLARRLVESVRLSAIGRAPERSDLGQHRPRLDWELLRC